MQWLVRLYRIVFARRAFLKLNRLLFRLSLSGMGILNYENDKVTGERHFLRSTLVSMSHASPCVVDVGANKGAYAARVSEINPQVRVLAFEPHPLTFKALQESVPDNVKTFNKAVGAAEGELELFDYCDADGSEHASIYKDVIESIHGRKSLSHTVEMVTLDAILKAENIARVDLLKIDTEGNELDVLRGAIEHISGGKIDVIHFEFNEMSVISRTFFKDIWDFLDGYDFYRLLPAGMYRLEKYEPLFCELFAFQNVVAIRA
jgi:FkbM family methyltransferase